MSTIVDIKDRGTCGESNLYKYLAKFQNIMFTIVSLRL